MFWGKGDSSKLAERERDTLTDLRRLVETGHIVEFNKEQTAIAKDALAFWASWKAATGLWKSSRNTVILIASIIASWWAFNDKMVAIFEVIMKGVS